MMGLDIKTGKDGKVWRYVNPPLVVDAVAYCCDNGLDVDDVFSVYDAGVVPNDGVTVLYDRDYVDNSLIVENGGGMRTFMDLLDEVRWKMNKLFEKSGVNVINVPDVTFEPHVNGGRYERRDMRWSKVHEDADHVAKTSWGQIDLGIDVRDLEGFAPEVVIPMKEVIEDGVKKVLTLAPDLSGKPMFNSLLRCDGLSLEQKGKVLVDVIKAISKLHKEKFFFHGDLKTDNIMVDHDDKGGIKGVVTDIETAQHCYRSIPSGNLRTTVELCVLCYLDLRGEYYSLEIIDAFSLALMVLEVFFGEDMLKRVYENLAVDVTNPNWVNLKMKPDAFAIAFKELLSEEYESSEANEYLLDMILDYLTKPDKALRLEGMVKGVEKFVAMLESNSQHS